MKYLLQAVAAAVTVGVVVAFVRAMRGRRPKTTVALKDNDTTIDLRLVRKMSVSPDTAVFRFALPSPEHTLGLPVGQHVHVFATVKGKEVRRTYTPISSEDDKGFVDVMVKVYRANVHPKFPEGGLMSQHMDSLRVGVDTLKFRGPNGMFRYFRDGRCTHGRRTLSARRVVMIAAGTGITPMLQIIRDVLKHADDKTRMDLIYANRHEDDILLRKELEECAKDGRFNLWFTLSAPAPDKSGWEFSRGHVDAAMIREHGLPTDSADFEQTVVLLCGPAGFVQSACKKNLEELGFPKDRVVVM